MNLPEDTGPLSNQENYEVIRAGPLKSMMEFSLVLASQRILHRITFQSAEYLLEAHPADKGKAEHLLEIYEQENREWNTQMMDTGDLRLSPAPFLFLAIPTIMFFFQNYNVLNPTLLAYTGRCHAEKILSGDWWRVFTGLTLHADPQHYLSNLLAGYFILNLLINRINTGLVMAAVTGMAGLANWLVALHSLPDHKSLGFSTAVFAALGFLSAVQARQNILQKVQSQKTWAPIIAAFFIVVLMGLGEGSDIKAHFYGFVVGSASGFGFSYLQRLTARLWTQILLISAVYGLFLWTWRLALYSFK